MRAILKEFNKNDTGAVQVIEMTLIFPLVLMVMGFLIYMASYVLQGVTIYNDAQRIAVAASREAGIPGYSELYLGGGVTAKADFSWSDDFSAINTGNVISVLMTHHRPYRYWGNGFLETSKKTELESNLESLVKNSSLLASTNVDCTITPINNILNQQIQVRVIKYISTPKLLQALGLSDNISIDITATAVVGDPAEFIRNTDMVFDLTEYMFENLKIGTDQHTLSQKMAIYKQKFSDMGAKLGLRW